MKVRINMDEKTVTDYNGRVYGIGGLLIKKDKEKSPDVFYPLDSSLCKAVIFRGLESDAIDIGNSMVHLL